MDGELSIPPWPELYGLPYIHTDNAPASTTNIPSIEELGGQIAAIKKHYQKDHDCFVCTYTTWDKIKQQVVEYLPPQTPYAGLSLIMGSPVYLADTQVAAQLLVLDLMEDGKRPFLVVE